MQREGRDVHARSANRLCIARHQGMPCGQIFSFRQQAIGAGGRQPVELGESRPKIQAIWHQLAARIVSGATARRNIEQAASQFREEDFLCVLILDLVQTTFCAAVTQGLPFRLTHLGQRFRLPERYHRQRFALPRLIDTRLVAVDRTGFSPEHSLNFDAERQSTFYLSPTQYEEERRKFQY